MLFDVLIEEGFEYDSSIFPIAHDRYGIPGASTRPGPITAPNGQQIVEFPLSTKGMLGRRVPVAGGGYFRLFPYWFTRWALAGVNRDAGHDDPGTVVDDQRHRLLDQSI